ncbi:hypothetical protein F444_09152 [Phytophthora nicotianae P1976]|uniref:RxLR effector PexRD54 WY domain-containing protein n=1 Tax=Phytophthora nicotianae P1976 TaxID=1317066 RepID=A0A081A8N1_PHYNI|nr:hypothetical protein F444_09152 [Phytophthora nicotianae P1976]
MQNSVAVARNLRWSKEDEISQERMIDVKLPGAVKLGNLGVSQTLKKLATSAKQRFTSNNQMATNRRFKTLKVGMEKSTLFESVPFQRWVQYVSKAYKKNPEAGEVAMVSTLRDHYGDRKLVKYLVKAQQNSNTMKIAKKFESIQIDFWIIEKKTADEMFHLLKLSVDKDDLLESALLKMWISFVKKLGKEDPYDALLLKLTKRFDEDELAHFLIRAKASDSTRHIASELERVQLKNWLSNGKTADDAFKLLRLNAATGDEILRNPSLRTWISYVTALDKEDAYHLLLVKLMKYYDEGELAKRLVAAKADWSSSVSVAKLEQALLNSWLAKEKTAEDAFKILRLSDDIGDDILRNPAVTTWYSYVKMRKQNPDELLFFELKKVLSDESLARTLVAAKKKGNAEIDVSVLEVEQFKYWLRGGKSADDIFTLLKLNKDGDKLFESPMLNTWVSYVVKLDEKNADELIFVALKNHYGIESVKEMIVQAKTRVTTENLASKLQEEVWRSTGKTEDDIFNLLKLDKDTLLEDPGLKTWVSYATKLGKHKETPDEFAVINDLERRLDLDSLGLARKFGEAMISSQMGGRRTATDVLKTLQAMQFKQWMTQKGWDVREVSHLLSAHPDNPMNARIILDFFKFYSDIQIRYRNVG